MFGSDLEEREKVGFGIMIVLGLVIPIATVVVLLLANGWLLMTRNAFAVGPHDMHAVLYGWLSHHNVAYHTEYIDQGDGTSIVKHIPYKAWTVGTFPAKYYTIILSSYVLYQAVEGLNWCFQQFKKALTPKKSKVGVVELQHDNPAAPYNR